MKTLFTKYSLLRGIIALALWVVCLLIYGTILEHVMYYHEQHRLFLFSRQYFIDRVAQYGFLEWAADFIIQFFYYPWLGAAILTSVITATYLMWSSAIRLFTGLRDWLQLALIPALLIVVMARTIEQSMSSIPLIFLISLVVWLFATLWRRVLWRRPLSTSLPSHPLVAAITSLVMATLFIAGTYIMVIRVYVPAERFMILTERDVKQRNYTSALRRIDTYLNSGHQNQLLHYFRNLILVRHNQLPQQMLNRTQCFGVEGLYFPWKSDSRQSEYGAFMLETVGMLNDAIRWESEAMAAMGENAPHLLNLARYNIAIGQPRIAKRFLNVLSQSLFYADTARTLLASVDIPQSVGIDNVVTASPHDTHFTNIIYMGHDLEWAWRNNPSNTAARDYLLATLLLVNDVIHFVECLPQDLGEMPQIYQEALMIYRLKVGEEEFAKTGFEISPDTEQRFRRYAELRTSGNVMQLEREFGNSYWFYLNFVSPYGDKVREPKKADPDRPSEATASNHL